MNSISGGSQPNPKQRKLDRYEHFVASYKDRVGEYPATPLELSPKNGVPTGERLDTFHRMAENLGVSVTSDLNENALPVGEKGYRQLLNTLASFSENTSDIVGGIKNIIFKKSSAINAGMTRLGEMILKYIPEIPEEVSYQNPPISSGGYQSVLDIVNRSEDCWKNSLRNPPLYTEHEAVHDFLLGACREFTQNSKLSASDNQKAVADNIMAFYIQQLQAKNPSLMNKAADATMLTGYFKDNPQELFTTLFEANASEIASRTPVTQEMANAIGSTVEHLTQQKEAYLPKVSPEQRKQLTALIDLIKDTPLNLQGWWKDQTSIRAEFEEKLPSIDYPPLLKVDKQLLNKDCFFWLDVNTDCSNTLANLDQEHPELYQFILDLNKQYPKFLGIPAKDHDVNKAVLGSLIELEKAVTEKPLTDFLNLLHPENKGTHENMYSYQYNNISSLLQELHSSYQFIEATGGRPANDDLFYTRHIAEGLLIPLHPESEKRKAAIALRGEIEIAAKTIAEAKFLAGNAHLLDLPKRFMTILDNLDEKELMITMLHRLVEKSR